MNVTVYCGSSHGRNPRFAEEARELASWIARKGHTLVYGGSSVGLMGTVSATALENGAQVIGVEPSFFIEMGVAQHELTELIEVKTMAERKELMISHGNAFVALPGGMGTLEEISEIMSRIRLRLTSAPCILVNIDGFYDPLRELLENMAEQDFVQEYEHSSTFFVDSAKEAIEVIESWEPHPHLDDWPSAIVG